MAYQPPKLTSPKPKALIRAQNDETTSISIPSPEELGLGSRPTDEAIDWARIERQLDSAGATGFQMQRLDTGFRFTVQMPEGPVAGKGTTKAEAVRNAMKLIGS